ncbi:hypothetical protein MKW92_001076, partial [Papaver armeniacum]
YTIMLNEQMQNGSSNNSNSTSDQPPLQSVPQMQETISDDEDDSFWQSRSQNRRDPLSDIGRIVRYFAERT